MERPANVFQRKMAITNCTKCVEYDLLMLECCGSSWADYKEYDKWYMRWKNHYLYEDAVGYKDDPPHTALPKPHSHEGNGKPKGLFAFSLTASPKDGKNKYDFTHAVEMIMNQKTCPVKRYSWYLETKDNDTHPHIHGIYETDSGGQIYTKVFKRYWSIWDPKPDKKLGDGFRGGYHKPVDFAVAYKEYISKDEGEHKTFGDWTDIGQLN